MQSQRAPLEHDDTMIESIPIPVKPCKLFDFMPKTNKHVERQNNGVCRGR